MTDHKIIDDIARGSFDHWNGEGTWARAPQWRKADWRAMMAAVIIRYNEEIKKKNVPGAPQHPVEPISQRPFIQQPLRPYRADAGDSNPEEE